MNFKATWSSDRSPHWLSPWASFSPLRLFGLLFCTNHLPQHTALPVFLYLLALSFHTYLSPFLVFHSFTLFLSPRFLSLSSFLLCLGSGKTLAGTKHRLAQRKVISQPCAMWPWNLPKGWWRQRGTDSAPATPKAVLRWKHAVALT